jgi:hypothetical protein
LRILDKHIFQDAVTETGNGSAYVVKGAGSIITLQITGTSTSRTIIFEGSVDGVNYVLLTCINLSTLDYNTQTTGKDELWQVDISGIHLFRTRVSAIGGGNITVVGRVVDA